MEDFTMVKTKTTGFSSPATDYIKGRLVIPNFSTESPYFTFFFRIGEGADIEGMIPGDIVAVDRKRIPGKGEICLGVDDEGDFVVYKFGISFPKSHWGSIVRIIRDESHKDNRISGL